MKATAAKNHTTNFQTPTAKPFFTKNGEGDFFSSMQELEQPFFKPSQQQEFDIQQLAATDPRSSPQIQKKCEACTQEEPVQDIQMKAHECENDPEIANKMGLSCQIETSPNPGSNENISFAIESSEIKNADIIENFVNNWWSMGGTERIAVHGYASCDGPESYNWRLSCDRANALAQELVKQGLNPSLIDLYAHGETNHFSDTDLKANRVATVGFVDSSGPIPDIDPPLPQPVKVLPCGTLPKEILNRPGCGGGPDFDYFDFQPLTGVSWPKRLAVSEANRLSDADLSVRMNRELSLLAGAEGTRMVSHFVGGSGSKLSHGASSILGKDALASGMFSRLNQAVIDDIKKKLSSMHTAGTIDCNAISLTAGAIPVVSFSIRDSTSLKAIIGGTQGLKIMLTSLAVDPGPRTFIAQFQYLICDDFGVDTDDLYSPSLIAFWILQHRRAGHVPFINELDITKGATGTY